MLPTKYASFHKRFVAYAIDKILAGLLSAFVLLPFALMTAGGEVIDNIFSHGWRFDLIAIPHAMFPGMFGECFGTLSSIPVALIVFWFLLYKVLGWLYFAVFESSPRQATPGKMMLGLFVTDTHGRRITFPRALGRTLSKILSQLFCWLGYLLALVTARSQALHDLIADTLVLEPAYAAPGVAPPGVVPPGAAPTPDLAAVEVPPQPAPVTGPPEYIQPAPGKDLTEKRPEPGTGITEEKPDEQDSGKDKPEQENK